MAALLVSGDAGVGKTRLVERVSSDPGAEDLLVLRGVCLPMSATTVPLMPLRTAFRRLPVGMDPPDVDGTSQGAPGGVLAAVDTWLDRTCRERPVVLVVDDVHWADEASLDVLTYVLAGPPDRSLAVLLTLRRGELPVGHPVRRWLADVRRLPSLSELHLGAFDRFETSEQLQSLLGAQPYDSLVTEVHERTGGNPYLTRLLVEGLPPTAKSLPGGLPGDLRSAVLRPWEQLSPPARELVLAVSVGGEVAVGPALDRAVELSGVEPGSAPGLLRDAVDSAVFDPVPDGGYWFHHPLQAEALESLLGVDEQRRMHAFLARACEEGLANGPGDGGAGEVTRLVAIAEHHSRAGELDAAYRWTMRALGAAETVGDDQATMTLLRRAVDLRPRIRGAAEPVADLLHRLVDAAALLGQHEVEHAAVETLLAGADEDAQPLLVAELLVRREHLRFSTSRGFLRIEQMRRAVQLSEPWPSSWQHGYALAEYAHASLWADVPEAQQAVAAAVRAADAIHHPRVTAYACAAAAMGAVFAEVDGGTELAARGVEAAAQARDWWGFVHATLWEANSAGANSGARWIGIIRERRQQLEDLGGPHPYLAWLSVCEADALRRHGDWRATARLLRVALGSDPGTLGVVQTRLVAATLAVLQGRLREAEDHQSRAEELSADTTAFLAWPFDAVRSLVRLEAGDARGAHEAAMSGLLSPGIPPTMAEWLCPLAARALAVLLADTHARAADPDEYLRLLDHLVQRFPHTVPDGSMQDPEYRREVEALDALYAAEVARGRDDPDQVALWRRAADDLDGVHPWDAAYAAYRAGEAVLLHHGGSREDAAAFLRRAVGLATELGAAPVLHEANRLARAARIPLDEVVASTEADDETLPGLTKREREVVAHIVAGRTYGEIARALFLSEKTVSSHVSNILRKTGCANRVELAGGAQPAGR